MHRVASAPSPAPVFFQRARFDSARLLSKSVRARREVGRERRHAQAQALPETKQVLAGDNEATNPLNRIFPEFSFVIFVSFCKSLSVFLRIAVAPFTIDVMRSRIAAAAFFVVCLSIITGCGGASHQIVGSWRLGDEPTAVVWEFSKDGSVLMGTNRGRYSFGDNNRIKIETSIATSVYQMELVGDKMTLKDPNGSKLVLTKVK